MSTENTMTFQDLQHQAHEIAQEYKRDGYDMTLRQLYYQLVARGFIANSQKSYKRVGEACTKARKAGWFALDLLVDRSRTVGMSRATTFDVDVDAGEVEARDYIQSVPRWCITADRWFGQAAHVSVWVEKEALAGVFDRPCRDLGVGLFACKGYSSLSALWQWLKGLERAHQAAKGEDLPAGLYEEDVATEAVVLYFGDHDPDGWQIPRSLETQIQEILAHHPLDVPPIRFERVALNMDQIREHNPPPFPAKPSSSRFDGYRDEHDTTDAWELDALTPDVLDRLIRHEVNGLFDEDVHALVQGHARQRRQELRERMRADGWMDGVL